MGSRRSRVVRRGSEWVDALAALPRGAWLALSVGLFVVSSWIAGHQELDPDPAARRTPLDAAWWRYPLESGDERRLPIVTADLHDVCALPDGRHVWAVGSGGMILRSADGGETSATSRTLGQRDPGSRPGV